MGIPTNLMGWRPSAPDARDRVYTAPSSAALTLPPSFDCSVPMPPVPFGLPYDQLNIGSCGPTSAKGDVSYEMATKLIGRVLPIPSALFIYYCTRMLMGTVEQDSGVDNRSLMKALNQFGWCDEELWPYIPSKLKVKPPQAAFDQAAERKVVEYLAVNQTLQDMKACLAGGDPFIFGFSVFDSFVSESVARTGDAPMPNLRRERIQGGHDVLIVGYSDAVQRFKFRNSWGTDWGNGGYGTLPYSFCTDPRYSSDFWTVRGSGYGPPPEPPTPPEPGEGWWVKVSGTGPAPVVTRSAA